MAQNIRSAPITEPTAPCLSARRVPSSLNPTRQPFPATRAKPHAEYYDPYGLDEMDDEDLDFIDDSSIEPKYSASPNTDCPKWRAALRGITGYNPALYGDDEGEACESSWRQQEQEELQSARVAAEEDAVELKKLQVNVLRKGVVVLLAG